MGKYRGKHAGLGFEGFRWGLRTDMDRCLKDDEIEGKTEKRMKKKKIRGKQRIAGSFPLIPS